MLTRSIGRESCTLVLSLNLAVFGVLAPVHAEDIVPVEQGWSPQQKQAWYTLSQGSRLIPLAWLRALEQPGDAPAGTPRLFLERAHIEKFRYLPAASTAAGQLPIGFAIDTQDDTDFSEITQLRWKRPQANQEPWAGFNCSACHTAEITYQDKRMRIEGGPTLADFQGFMKALNVALAETRDNDAKWNRFAGTVLQGANTAANRTMLKAALTKLIDWQRKVETANATPLDYGFGRLDAFGHIFNKVLLRVEAPEQVKNPSDAPVSYPFLWNIHQQNKVQWNGIAPKLSVGRNFDVGALGRNLGEVIGVFADLTIEPIGPAIDGYNSSARIDNLIRLEQQITTLKPPVWPDVFPAIDPNKWEAGQRIFDKPDGCKSCHTPLRRDDLTTPIEVEMTRLIGPNAIKTDPWMACNAYTYQAQTGLLRGTPKKFFLFSSLPFQETGSLAEMLGATVAGALWNDRDDVIDAAHQSIQKETLQSMSLFDPKLGPAVLDPGRIELQLLEPVRDSAKAERLKRCLSEGSPTLAYKGRPLTGIWATPPFLHNGSVPTLYDLLLPPEQRPQSFALGTREFDPEKVGYVTNESRFATDKTRAENGFVFNTRDANGPIPGNANSGHDYGNASLLEDERQALVEYMKAVGGRRAGDRIVP
jgi:hypothetical protein